MNHVPLLLAKPAVNFPQADGRVAAIIRPLATHRPRDVRFSGQLFAHLPRVADGDGIADDQDVRQLRIGGETPSAFQIRPRRERLFVSGVRAKKRA